MSFAPLVNFFKAAFADVNQVAVIAQQPQVAAVIGSIPTVGPMVNTIIGSIMAIEKLIPQNGQGPAKKTVVTAIVNATQPNIPAANLSASIDGFVAALNKLQDEAEALEAAVPKS